MILSQAPVGGGHYPQAVPLLREVSEFIVWRLRRTQKEKCREARGWGNFSISLPPSTSVPLNRFYTTTLCHIRWWCGRSDKYFHCTSTHIQHQRIQSHMQTGHDGLRINPFFFKTDIFFQFIYFITSNRIERLWIIRERKGGDVEERREMEWEGGREGERGEREGRELRERKGKREREREKEEKNSTRK